MFALWLIFQIECRKSMKGHEILVSFSSLSAQLRAELRKQCTTVQTPAKSCFRQLSLRTFLFSSVVVNFGKYYLAGCDVVTVWHCASPLICFPGGAMFHLWPRMRVRESLPRSGCKTCLLWRSYCLSVDNYCNYSFPFPSLPRPARCS